MANVYNRGKYILLQGTTPSANWLTGSFTVALVTSSYSYDPDHNSLDDVTNELSGGNYARGTISNPTITESDANDRIEFDADDITFTSLESAAGTPARVVIAENVGASDIDRYLICSNTILSAPVPNGSNYTVTHNATGLINLTFISGMYNRGMYVLIEGATDAVSWLSDSIGALLVTSSYTFSEDHNTVADITNELSGGNYARVIGITSPTITENDTDNRVELDCDDTTFTALEAAAGTPAAIVFFENTGATDADRQLLCYNALSSPPTPNGSDYIVQNSSTGVINFTD